MKRGEGIVATGHLKGENTMIGMCVCVCLRERERSLENHNQYGQKFLSHMTQGSHIHRSSTDMLLLHAINI